MVFLAKQLNYFSFDLDKVRHLQSIVCRGQPGMMQSHRSDVESAVRNKDSAVILYNCIVKKTGSSSLSLHLNEMGSDWVIDDESVLALDSMFILSEHS